MSKSTFRTILGACGLAAAGAIIFSVAAHAGPGQTSHRCQGASRDKVIKCCEQMIVNSSYRRIMGTSGRCEGAVVCSRISQGNTYGLSIAGAGTHTGAYRCWLRKIKRWEPNDDRQDPQGGGEYRGDKGPNQDGKTAGVE